MEQSKRASLLESLANTFIGFVISIVVGYFVFPMFGMPKSLASSFWITVVFTVVSIGRNYIVRRVFNFLHVKGKNEKTMV